MVKQAKLKPDKKNKPKTKDIVKHKNVDNSVSTSKDAQSKPILSEPDAHSKDAEYQAFINWSALPIQDRKAIGLPLQKDFCKKYEVHPSRLATWKKRSDFAPSVRVIMKSWLKDLTPTVMRSLFEKAIQKGFDNPKYIEMWLAYIEDFNPKQEIEVKHKQEFTTANLGNLISYLPLEKQKEFYDTFNRLIDEAEHLYRVSEGKEITEADINNDDFELSDTANLVNESNRSGDKVAKEATADIRGHLEGKS